MKIKILFFSVLLAASNLFGAYEVKIAKYKNHEYLMLEIVKIKTSEYRNNILIEKKNDYYYVTSTRYESEDEVKKALRVYKKMFPDAFISEVEQKNIAPAPAKAAVQTPEVKMSEPKSPEAESPEPETHKPIEKEQINILDAEKLLENKTVYLCYEDGPTAARERVIQMDFKKEYVVYTKLNSKNSPIHIPYTFDKDCVILSISGLKFKYQLYQESQDFLSAKSFIDDKKGQQIRYYFDKNLAVEFAKNHSH